MEEKNKNIEKHYTQKGYKGFLPGNPGGGRPPGSLSLLAILKDKLAEIPENDKRTFAEIFIENTLQDALDLDGPSRKMIMQYIEGLPMQKTELTHIIPKPLDDVSENNGIQQNKIDEEKDKGDSGRNISEQDSEHPAVFDSEVSV
jgi:hypothetical protein